jgi:hypothetical protein
MKRYAIIKNASSMKQLDAYLPGNYEIVAEVPAWQYDHNSKPQPVHVIAGEDNAGWTLDGYVLPRLASGLIWGEEIDLSHPVMNEVPA